MRKAGEQEAAMNSGPTSQAPPAAGLLAAMLWTLVYIVLANFGMIALSHWMMPLRSGLSMFAGWVAQLALIIGLAAGIARAGGGINLILILGFAVYSLVYGMLLGHIPRLLTLRETPTISVSEADALRYADCDAFHFSDGYVDVQHSGSRRLRRRGSGMATYDHVAPLIPATWKAGDPIPAWVGVWGADGSLPPEWKQDLRGGYPVGPNSSLNELVQETCERYSLHTSPRAPVISWSADPAAALRRTAGFELGILMAIDALGFLSLFLSTRPRGPGGTEAVPRPIRG